MNEVQEFLAACRNGRSYRKFAADLEENGVAIFYQSLMEWEKGTHLPNLKILKLQEPNAKGSAKIFCQSLINLVEKQKQF